MSKSNYTLLRTLMMYTIYFSFSPLFARYAACLLQFRWAMEKRTINKWVSIKSIRRFWITCNDISLPELRTWTCFPVTSVSRAASTAVRANSIGALRLHMTDGRRGGAFINICVKKIRTENKLVLLKFPVRNTTLLDFFFLADNVQIFFSLFHFLCGTLRVVYNFSDR